MTKLDRIKAEVAYRMESAKKDMDKLPNAVRGYLLGRYDECSDLMSFIRSLEEESTSFADVDEAAKEWYESVKYKSDLSGTPIMAFKGGVKYESNKVERLATDMRDKGLRNQLDAYKNGEDCIASYWDGYADCAKAVLRELDKNNK